MPTPMNHRDCDHEATKADRAKCRKARAQAYEAEVAAGAARLVAANELINIFDDRCGTHTDWVARAAISFTDFTYEASQAPGGRLEAALALLAYFAPSGDDDEDRRRLANGYIITTSAHEILRITLRRFS